MMIKTDQNTLPFYSAHTFRLLLDSLSRPGKIVSLALPTFLGESPHYHSSTTGTDIPLNPYASGALLTLLDRETSFVAAANGQWLEPDSPVSQWLALRSGSYVAEPGNAGFALFCDGESGELLAQLSPGTLLEPEESTTVFYCVADLTTTSRTGDDRWLTLVLRGPGIAQTQTISVAGLSRGEVEHIIAARQRYPLGIDVYLIDATGQCIGLPRTTRIQLVDSEQMEG